MKTLELMKIIKPDNIKDKIDTLLRGVNFGNEFIPYGASVYLLVSRRCDEWTVDGLSIEVNGNGTPGHIYQDTFEGLQLNGQDIQDRTGISDFYSCLVASNFDELDCYDEVLEIMQGRSDKDPDTSGNDKDFGLELSYDIAIGKREVANKQGRYYQPQNCRCTDIFCHDNISHISETDKDELIRLLGFFGEDVDKSDNLNAIKRRAQNTDDALRALSMEAEEIWKDGEYRRKLSYLEGHGLEIAPLLQIKNGTLSFVFDLTGYNFDLMGAGNLEFEEKSIPVKYTVFDKARTGNGEVNFYEFTCSENEDPTLTLGVLQAIADALGTGSGDFTAQIYLNNGDVFGEVILRGLDITVVSQLGKVLATFSTYYFPFEKEKVNKEKLADVVEGLMFQ